jgi:transketolase
MNKIDQKDFHQSQRGYFAGVLYNLMVDNENIVVLTGDLGYGVFDKIRDDFPLRFINCGASEQAMMGIAVGLAIEGKILFVYSITPFLIRRPYETIKLYLDGERLPVKLIGSGRDKDYAHDGPSHDATDIPKLLETLPNIISHFPETKEDVETILNNMLTTDQAEFLSLTR